MARATGHAVPRFTAPDWLISAFIPFGRWLGPRFGVGPDLGETVRVSRGVTYWVTSDKARTELGYAPRPLVDGLAELLARPPLP